MPNDIRGLPVYIQAVLLSSPTRSGLQLLPTVTAMLPFSFVAAVIVEKTGKYKPVHFGSSGLMVVGTELLAMLQKTLPLRLVYGKPTADSHRRIGWPGANLASSCPSGFDRC